ncbi:DNA replication protein psf1 [Chytridiales sp. JEL 0842]|nr:DNA replication protein psf1 [Chytridiales sp. JEL 0842]
MTSCYGDEAIKLIKEVKRYGHDTLPPYNYECVRNTVNETKMLNEQLNYMFQQRAELMHALKAEEQVQMEMGADAGQKSAKAVELVRQIQGVQVAGTMHQVSMNRNRRCLLAYHRHRLDTLRSIAWDLGGGAAMATGQLQQEGVRTENGGRAGGGGLGGMPVEIQRNLAQSEHEFLNGYRNALEELKGEFMDVDIGGALVPPKDLFVEVRVMKELGEVLTESGHFERLAKGSSKYMRRTDVEQFIMLGYLTQI